MNLLCDYLAKDLTFDLISDFIYKLVSSDGAEESNESADTWTSVSSLAESVSGYAEAVPVGTAWLTY